MPGNEENIFSCQKSLKFHICKSLNKYPGHALREALKMGNKKYTMGYKIKYGRSYLPVHLYTYMPYGSSGHVCLAPVGGPMDRGACLPSPCGGPYGSWGHVCLAPALRGADLT